MIAVRVCNDNACIYIYIHLSRLGVIYYELSIGRRRPVIDGSRRRGARQDGGECKETGEARPAVSGRDVAFPVIIFWRASCAHTRSSIPINKHDVRVCVRTPSSSGCRWTVVVVVGRAV